MATKIKEVIKRDGKIVDYDKAKIFNAVYRAAYNGMGYEKLKSTEISGKITDAIDSKMQKTKANITVEEIQDMVEMELMSVDPLIAKKYIQYRDDRTREREKHSELKKKVKAIVNCENVKNSNANVDEYSFGGRKFESAGALHKEIALDMMSEDVRNAFESGRIYIHDLDSYDIGETNCLFVDMEKLLKEGFTTRNCDVRPANSFATACQLVAVIFQAQSQGQFGGVGSAAIDRELAPYVLKSFKKKFVEAMVDLFYFNEEEAKIWVGNNITSVDTVYPNNDSDLNKNSFDRVKKVALKRLEKEGKQAAQAMVHNLNTLNSGA